MVMVPQDEWNRITKTVDELKDLVNIFLSQKSGDLLTMEQVQEILGLSGRTLLRYRKLKKLPFIQVGRKIYVKRQDLDAFIDTYYIPSIA